MYEEELTEENRDKYSDRRAFETVSDQKWYIGG